MTLRNVSYVPRSILESTVVVNVQHLAYDMPDTQQASSSGVRRSTRTRTFRVATAQKPKPEEPADVESSELSELSDEESSDFDEPAHRE